jgi:diacylglycerol kinase family enzyme
MRILVANSRSGAVRRLAGGQRGRAGRHAAEAALRRALAAAGAGETAVRVVPPRRIEAALRAAAQEAEELWVAGGDGTLRTAARFLIHTGKPLGVVPLGTMNLLARDLAIPLDLDGALRALAEAPVGRIDVGRMDEGLFLNKSSLGLYPEMIIDRDRRQRLWGYGKWPAMLRAMWRALRRNRLMELTLETEGAPPRRIRSPAVVVATNAYEFRTGRLFRKTDLAAGELTAYISHETGWLGSLGQFAKLFLGTLEGDPELEVVRTQRLTIDFARSRPVANDGEVEFVRGPVSYSVEARALAVRWPGLAARDEAA